MAIQCPADPRVACCFSNPPSSQRVPELQASPSFQYPKQCDSMHCASTGNNQIHRKGDPYRRSAAHVSAQHSCYFVVSANETSATHSVGHHHQQMESSKERDSNLSLDVWRQQSDQLDLSSCTSSAAHQGKHLGITAQSISLQNYTPPEQKKSPLLYTLLMESSPFENRLPQSSLKETNAKIAPNANTELYSTLCQQRSSSYYLSNPSETEGNEMESFSDDSIQNFIWHEVRKQQRSGNVQSSREGAFHTPDTNPSLPSSCILPTSSSAGHLPTTSVCDEEGLGKKVFNSMKKHSITEIGQASKEDTSGKSEANVELNTFCGSDRVWSAMRSHSTDCPEILEKVAPTFSKAEDDSPEAVTAVSQVVSGQLTLKHPRTSLDYSSSQDENKAFGSESNRTLKYLKKHTAGSVQSVIGSMSSKENQGECFKNKAQPCMDRCAEVTAYSSVAPPMSDNTNGSKYQWSCANREGRVDVAALCLQSDISTRLSSNQIRSSPPVESKNEVIFTVALLKDPQYDDISDEDLSQHATNLQYTEHAELACFQDPRNEHASVDETTMVENLTVEKSSPTQETEPSNNDKLQDGSCGHEQDLIQVTVEISSNEKVPQLKSVSGSPSSEEPETDDDCDVFTIIMTDLHFEAQDKDQYSPENVMHDCTEGGDQETQSDKSPVHCEQQVQQPVQSQIEEFDSIDTFLQANTVKKTFELTFSSSPLKVTLDSDGEPDTVQNRRESCSEPDDSCETEDSCDYSTESEHNYLTVSRKLLRRRAVPLPAETDSDSDNDDEYEVKSLQNSKSSNCIERPKLLVETKAACENAEHETNTQSASNTDDIIVIDSDTEDESYPTCPLNTGKKRTFSADSDSAEDVLYVETKRPKLSITVDSPCDSMKDEFLETSSCLDSTAQQKHDMDEDKDLRSEPLSLREKSKELTDTSAGVMRMQHKTKKSAGGVGVILIDLVAEDTHGINYAEKPKKRHHSSVSKEDADAPCLEREAHEENLIITRLSPVASPVQQHQSKHQLTKVMQNSCFVQSNTQQSRQLNEGQGESLHVQHKNTRRKNERPRAKKRSEDRCAAKRLTEPVDSPCPAGNKKPKKPIPSPNSPNNQSQTRDKRVYSPLGPEPANPYHNVQKSSEPNKNVKTFKDYRQGSSETAVAKTSRKSIDTCEKNSLHMGKNQKGPSSSISNPGDGKHRSTMKMCTIDISRPKILLKQQSLPNPKDLPSSNYSGQYLEKRQKCTDVSEKPLESCNTSVPRKITSFRMQQSLSSGSASSTKGPSTSAVMKSSAKEHVAKAWDNSFVPTRRDRKRSLEEQKIHCTNTEKCRKDKTGVCHNEQPPRQRHNVPRMEHPLMKKTKADAIRLTKAKNRDLPAMLRPVGEGYKWGEKSTVVPRTKGQGQVSHLSRTSSLLVVKG